MVFYSNQFQQPLINKRLRIFFYLNVLVTYVDEILQLMSCVGKCGSCLCGANVAWERPLLILFHKGTRFRVSASWPLLKCISHTFCDIWYLLPTNIDSSHILPQTTKMGKVLTCQGLRKDFYYEEFTVICATFKHSSF